MLSLIRHSTVFISLLLLPVTNGLSSVSTDRFIPAGSPYISYSGRVDLRDPKLARYTWPGISISLRTTSSVVKAVLRDSINIYHVIVDGKMSRDFMTNPQDRPVSIYEDLGNNEVKTISIYKRTESPKTSGEFLGFLIEQDSLLFKIKKPERRIEFIGDSFTAGYGNTASEPSECDVRKTTNSYFSYASLLGRSLSSETILTAWSGRGVVQNYGDISPNPENSIIAGLNKTLQNETQLWDFSHNVPDLVIMFMGLNDFSTKGDPSAEMFKKGYHRIIDHVFLKYKDVKVICLGTRRYGIDRHVQEIVSEQRTKRKDKILYFQVPHHGKLNGCHGHPHLEIHRSYEKQLRPIVQKFMGW